MRKSLIAFVVGIVLAGCESNQVDRSMMVDPEMPVSYAADIQPIFDRSCDGSGCHIQGTTNGVRLSSYQATISSRGIAYGRLIVEPGAPDESPIVDKISSSNPEHGVRMPFGQAPLSGADIGLISTWIEEGAEDN